jgi:adenine-specific DNA-methyltransferase
MCEREVRQRGGSDRESMSRAQLQQWRAMDKIDLDSPEAKSVDVVADNVRLLGELFPELLTEGPSGTAVDVDVLKQLVGDSTVTDADEKYGLSWFGKRDARKMALTPSLGTLLPCPDESEDWDTTKNFMIEGDNLEVLKLLQKSYSGKVKLIYIDPPYNTGKDFVYPDNYTDNIKNYLELTGQTEEGRKTTSNTESSGRFHTDWLNMMYPRLKLARNLLADDGVMFVSIDDNEIENMLQLVAELFGDENQSTTFIRQKKKKPSFLHANVGSMTEFVISTTRNRNSTFPFSVDTTTEGKKFPFNNAGNGRNILTFPPQSVNFALQTADYEPQDMSEGNIVTHLLDKVEVRGGTNLNSFRLDGEWRYSQAKLEDIVDNGEVITISKAPFRPNHVKDGGEIKKMHNLLTPSTYGAGTNEDASDELEILMGGSVFDNPKPSSLVRILCQAVTYGDPDALVLDFFAGSGTTGQAVMEQNALDGGNRQFILVQLPEPLLEENKEQAAALAFCEEHGLDHNIAALTAERLRRAGAKVRSENPKFSGDVGFRVFKLAESNIRAWDPLAPDLEDTLLSSQDHLVEGRTELDVLYEILLKRGLDLCVPIETREIQKHKVNAVGGGVLFACLDSHIAQDDVEALGEGIVAWREELGVVGDVNCIFKDSAFDNDVAKTNMSSILEQAGFTRIQSL